jgi:hypothetical protein
MDHNLASMMRQKKKKKYLREGHTLQISRNLGIISCFYEMRKATFQLLDDPANMENNCQQTHEHQGKTATREEKKVDHELNLERT